MATHSLRRARGAALLALVWLMSTGLFGQCEFFKPTSPDRPTAKNPIFPDYTSPTLTLETLRLGIVDKNGSNGQDVYVRAFADSLPTGADGTNFIANFDVSDLDQSPRWDRGGVWSRGLEQAFYVSFVTLFSLPYEMTWEPYEANGNDSGTNSDSLLHRQYKIYSVASGTKSLIATGVADLYFVKSPGTANRWAIRRWDDMISPDARPTQFPDEVSLGLRRLRTQ
jgi:hypothetical protein